MTENELHQLRILKGTLKGYRDIAKIDLKIAIKLIPGSQSTWSQGYHAGQARLAKSYLLKIRKLERQVDALMKGV